ncbi:MAG TPA: HPr family phosphocarrier protein [Anaerovoracaceae bacterium]|nr:HPr family phosphocarrier protein [Anaerovoracaceae bacterium]
MLSKEITVKNKTGLHARPASEFVKTAGKFSSAISIEFRDKKINAKSIVHVLSAGIAAGSTIILSAEGEDEQQAIETLADVIDKFEE